MEPNRSLSGNAEASDARQGLADDENRMSNAVIAVAGDMGYERPLCVALLSAMEASRGRLNAVVLDNGLRPWVRSHLSNEFKKRWPRAELTWLGLKEGALEGLPCGLQHISVTAYARLKLVELLEPTIDLCIYLDSDTLCQIDLCDMIKLPLGGKPTGAVVDFAVPFLGSPGGIGYALEESSERRRCPEFNSGVLLIDLKKWRRVDLVSRAESFIRKWGAQIQSDQDVLNHEMAGDWEQLPPRWNLQLCAPSKDLVNALSPSAYHDVVACNNQKCIFHFVGSMKPWNSGLTSPHVRAYWTAVRTSNWLPRKRVFHWSLQHLVMAVKHSRFARCIR